MTVRKSPAARLLLGASALALTIACSVPAPAMAGTYTATDDASLRTAIANANADPDPNATITLTNSFTVSNTAFAMPTKPLTIDTQGFVLSGASTGNGSINFTGSLPAVTMTLNGTLVGGNSTAVVAAGTGLNLNGTAGSTGQVVNNGSITGGSATNAGISGGIGVSVSNGPTLVNNGTISGGVANAFVRPVGNNAGSGVALNSGSSLINNLGGTVQGANSQGTGAGAGLYMNALGGGITATNFGTIRGGSDLTGAAAGNAALRGRGGSATAGSSLTNFGLLEGGNGAAAITNDGATWFISIVNSGTIRGGTGQSDAIVFGATATSRSTLELQAGSVIQGNVIGGALGANDTLRLGGDTNASFDVSAIGPTAQYQNFDFFQKTGASTWSLTGTGTVATPWAISQGTLQIGDGTATGSFIGDVTDNATLAFNRPDAFTFANVISGTGGVSQVGSGTTNLTSVNTYSGPTNVSRGTLAVNGSIVSAVTVQSGGTLGGNGTVGATTVQSGGNIAPGNSIGTLHVNGAFVQNAGSIYLVEVDPNSNASDLILVNGAATVASGAGLNVSKITPGDYRLGTTYTVLTATNGVTGTYALSGETTTLSPYIGLKDSYDANNAYLTVVQTGDPGTAAQTPNQQGTAGGLPGGGNIGTGLINSPSEADARDAFDKLSGEALASARGALVSGSLLVRDAALDRLRDVCSAEDRARQPGCLDRDRPLVWVQGFGNWGHIGGNANAASLSHSTGGFLIGTDVPVYDWRVGFFGGYSRTDFQVDARSSWGSSDNYHLGAYGGTNWDDVAIRLGASYSWNDLSTERQVAFGNFSNDLHASYNAGTAQIFGEVGESFAFDRLNVEPFANLSYVNLRTYAFREGGGDAALSSAANTQEDTFTTIGLRPSTDFSVLSLALRLKGMFGWRHTFGTVTPNATVAFAGGNSFTVTGAPIARDAGVVEAGISTNVNEAAAVNLTYGAQFGGRESNNGIRGTLAVAF